MAIDKKLYDKKRYLIIAAAKMGLDIDDPDLESKVYKQRPTQKKLNRIEVGLIGVDRAEQLRQKKFDRYYKAWCIQQNRMGDYEIFLQKKKQ